MAQPPRSSEPSLKNPLAFRVTAAEMADIDAAVEKYGDELPERSRGAALRRAAHDVVHGVVVPLAEDERIKLDRLVDARRAELVRFGVRVNVTPADVLLHLLGAATVDSVVVAPVVPEKASEAPTSTAATLPDAEVVVDVAPAPKKASEAPPVVAATSEEAPVVTPDAVRAALGAALVDTKQSTIAAALAPDPSFNGVSLSSIGSALSRFESASRPLSAGRLAALAAYLTKEGHL